MLKELGLGALLFIAGDSELGRRAGDALIADKIGDALEEGGFDAVSLGPWAVGRDDAGFLLIFPRCPCAGARYGSPLSRHVITPSPLPSPLKRARLGTTAGRGVPPLAWSFTEIDLEVAGWRSIRALSADATGLHSLGSVATLVAYSLPGTLRAPEALIIFTFSTRDGGGRWRCPGPRPLPARPSGLRPHEPSPCSSLRPSWRRRRQWRRCEPAVRGVIALSAPDRRPSLRWRSARH